MPDYPVPWDAVIGLWPHILHHTAASQDGFSKAFTAKMRPPPRLLGIEDLPASPRFLLAANHYQRKGLWIAYPASVITQALREHYGLPDPPVKWVVTANWPPIRVGRWRLPSPGDWLLPRVAHALSCYAVSFAGTNPAGTARSLLRLLRETRDWEGPIGLFPEGVAGTAGKLTDALPGIDRLIAQLAKMGRPVVPAAIWEEEGVVVRFGPPLAATEPVMQGIDRLRPQPSLDER